MSVRPLCLLAALLPVFALRAQNAVGPAPSAAVVAGADVFVNIDLAGARSSPLYKVLNKEEKPEMAAKMKAATGLAEEDFVRVSGSADIDTIDFSAAAPDPDAMAKLPAVLSIHLAKSVSAAQYRKGLELVFSQQPGKEFTFADAGTGLLKITPKDADAASTEAVYSGLAGDGKQVFLGGNVKSVQDAIARAASGKLEKLPPALGTMSSNASHFQLALVLPQAAKDGIGKAVDEATKATDPGAVMMAGMLAPLKGLSKVAVRAQLNPADLGLMLLADLSTPEFAGQANMLLNTMVLPMVAQGLGQDPTKPRITVSAQGAILTLKGNVSQAELENMPKAGAGLDAGAPADAPAAP